MDLDICRHYGIKVEAKPWNKHEPKHLMETDQATVLLDSQILRDRHINCNQLDIVIKEKETARCMVTDVAIPNDYNIQNKTTEKMSKYIDQQIECDRMWSKKVEMIPVTTGATGIVEKNLKENN